MPWSKLDDAFHEHPKIASMSDKAFRLYVCSITYSKRHRLKGVLTEGHRLVLFRLTGACQDHDDELVALHGWDLRPDGSRQIHDIETWNPDYDEDLLQKRAEAGRLGGIQSGITRSKMSTNEANAKQVASGIEANAKQTRSKREANAKQRESDSDTNTNTERLIKPPPDSPISNVAPSAPREKSAKEKKEQNIIPPCAELVAAFFGEHATKAEGRKFYLHYQANGWKVGRVKMRDWHAAAYQWIENKQDFGGSNGSKAARTFEEMKADNLAAIRAMGITE